MIDRIWPENGPAGEILETMQHKHWGKDQNRETLGKGTQNIAGGQTTTREQVIRKAAQGTNNKG